MLENFTQVTPLLFTFSSLIIPIYTGNLKDLNLFVLLNISSVVNHVLKEFVFKPLLLDAVLGRLVHEEQAFLNQTKCRLVMVCRQDMFRQHLSSQPILY